MPWAAILHESPQAAQGQAALLRLAADRDGADDAGVDGQAKSTSTACLNPHLAHLLGCQTTGIRMLARLLSSACTCRSKELLSKPADSLTMEEAKTLLAEEEERGRQRRRRKGPHS